MDSTSSPTAGAPPPPGLMEMQSFMLHLEELRAQSLQLAEQLNLLRLQQQAPSPTPTIPVRNSSLC